MFKPILIFILSLNSISWAADPDPISEVRRFFIASHASPLMDQFQINLKINLNEEFPNYVGGVSLIDQELVIDMGAEFHKEPGVTPGAYLAILCHELGHFLAGTPYSDTSAPSSHWQHHTPPSSEGQSDYYSGSCLKTMMLRKEIKKLVNAPTESIILSKCNSNFSEPRQQQDCGLALQAGLELSNYLFSIFQKYGPTDYNSKPDLNRTETDGRSLGNLYPSLQCRLETIMAGVLLTPRPSCWYNLNVRQ